MLEQLAIYLSYDDRMKAITLGQFQSADWTAAAVASFAGEQDLKP